MLGAEIMEEGRLPADVEEIVDLPRDLLTDDLFHLLNSPQGHFSWPTRFNGSLLQNSHFIQATTRFNNTHVSWVYRHVERLNMPENGWRVDTLNGKCPCAMAFKFGWCSHLIAAWIYKKMGIQGQMMGPRTMVNRRGRGRRGGRNVINTRALELELKC